MSTLDLKGKPMDNTFRTIGIVHDDGKGAGGLAVFVADGRIVEIRPDLLRRARARHPVT
jgi:hypothetical protein